MGTERDGERRTSVPMYTSREKCSACRQLCRADE